MNDSDVAVIDEVVHRARIAQQTYEEMGSQELYDNACCAVAWALMEPERNAELASLAVAKPGSVMWLTRLRKTTIKHWGCCAICMG